MDTFPLLVDSHCHLDDKQFDADRDAVIERAHAAGLKYMLTIGIGDGPPDLEVALRLAEHYPSVFATVGIHPNDAAKLDLNTFKNLEQLLRHPKVMAMGEIGLDYHWGVPKEIQMPVFRRQLELAADARMPVVIHTRDAWEDTLSVLEEHWAPTGLPGVLHCFTGDAALARRCLSFGFYLAFGGVTTFPKATDVREAARITPAEKLLVETDSPYLAPVPFRGKRNEPAYVVHTARAVADARGVPLDELMSQTTANFEYLFRLTAH
ncbi:MAG TPA: TatD family hydrolase [Bryobacteraceae bacterium]|jgi:TatD DNase family protein|nr:TatD family hydrolase [Bryobacteraceae bacterium]